MGAPSVAHQTRVALLDTLAVLAGYTLPVRLAPRLDPDVVRLDSQAVRLFVADAKATETPWCAETQRRLYAYASAARRWEELGIQVSIAVCHGGGPWWRPLELAARNAGLSARRAMTEAIAPDTVLTWME